MNRTMKKHYVKPQTESICVNPELLSVSGVSSSNVNVQEWNKDESSNLGSEKVDVSDDLW